MKNVGVETTQNVLINYELASIGDRIFATLLDWLVFLGYFLIVFIALSPINFQISIYLGVVLYLPIFLYHLLCEVFFNGQSLGKKQMNIKVMKLNGSRPNLGAYLLRWIVRPIDFFMYGAVAMVSMIVSNKGQRLGDIAAGTTVIKLKQRVDLSHHDVFKPQREDYAITFPQVNLLTDKDITLITDSLQVFKETANQLPLNTIEEKVKDHLNIRSNLPTAKFLYTIVKDYTHYNS